MDSGTAELNRRDIIWSLVGLGVLPPAVAAKDAAAEEFEIPLEPVDPGSTLPSQQTDYTSEDVAITSFDGTTIMATVFEPTTAGPHPAIMSTHGWAGTRGSGESYASHGYVVLSWDSRGFGESGGTVSLNGENERRDASALMDWLAQRDSVQTDAPGNPRVGMDGASYGGGIQTRLAANDDRVDAIVPRAMWYDVFRALAPNRVIKLGWAQVLAWAGTLRGDLSDEFKSRTSRIINEYEITAGDQDYFGSRSPKNYGDVQAPMLVLSSFVDRLFPAEEGIDVARWGRASGVETALVVGNGTTHTILGPDPPGADAYDQFADQAALDWLDYHLKGAPDPNLAPVNYYNEGSGTFVEATEFPPAEATSRTRTSYLQEPVTLSGGTENVATVEYVMGRETELVGRPEVQLRARPIGTGRSHLMAVLRRVSDGEVTVLKDQVQPAKITADERISFAFNALQAQFQPGDRLEVALAADSEALTEVDFFIGGGLFLDTAEDAAVELPAGAVDLTLPAIRGPQAQLPIVPGAENRPKDLDGDDLFADVNGDGTVDILDVQLLFSALATPEVQNNAWAYNFSGSDPDRVTVFDLQALYHQL